jgi:hypothetical protein
MDVEQHTGRQVNVELHAGAEELHADKAHRMTGSQGQHVGRQVRP